MKLCLMILSVPWYMFNGHSTSSATLYKDISAMVLFMLFYVLFITILCINNHIEYKKK
jgi:hypothetical protein